MPPPKRSDGQRGERASHFADDGVQEHGPHPVHLHQLQRFRAQLRREVDQIVDRDRLTRVRRRLGRERLRRRVPLARHVALRHRPLLDRPDRLAGHAIEDIEEGFLARQRHRLDRLAVDVDVGQDRRRGEIVVPHRMMHHLVMPLPLAGLQIDANQAVGEQIVARPMSAILIRRRIFHRQIDQAEIFIHGDLRPDAGVAVDFGRVVQPGVVAELARFRNRVELPKLLAGPDVEARAPGPWCCCA